MKTNHTNICYNTIDRFYFTFNQQEVQLYKKGEERLKSGHHEEVKQHFVPALIENLGFINLPYDLTLTTSLTGNKDREQVSRFYSCESLYVTSGDHSYRVRQIYLKHYMIERGIASAARFQQKRQHSSKGKSMYIWFNPENMECPINSQNGRFHFKMNKDQFSSNFVPNRLYTRGNHNIYFLQHIEKVTSEGRIFNLSIDGSLTIADTRFRPPQYQDEYLKSATESKSHYYQT